MSEIETVQHTAGGYLVNGAQHVPMAPGNRHYREVQAWISAGGVVEDEPGETPEELRRRLIGQIQYRLDSFAQTRDYDDIKSACGYATSSDAKFASEGQYCVDARTDTWKVAYVILDEVEQGTRPKPNTIEDFEAELPELNWPV